MNYLSLCSGIEAASAAWHPLGWKPVAFSEIEPFPRSVLAHRFPHVPNWGDMTKYQEWPDANVDVLVGGTPCQSFSVAGLRKGLDDPRGNLMLTYGAIAAKYRPAWLVWENVPGVLSSNRGRDFGTFLGMLGQLGYGFAYRVLDAQYFGLAQRRKRVFVVGCLGDWRRAAAVLFERHSLSGHPAPSREARKVAPTIPSRSTGGGGLGSDFDCDGGLIHAPDVALCLNAGGMGRIDSESESETMIAHSLRGEGFDASEDGTGRGTPLVPVAFSCKDHGADAGNLAPTLRAMGHSASHANAGGQIAVAFDTTQITSKANRSNPKQGDPCHPLAAGAHPPVLAFQSSQSGVRVGDAHATLDANNGARRHNGALVGSAVRRLTPTECERLQGFPDGWTQVPHRGKPAADGPRYKALGNSMAVPCMAWIGSRIALVSAISNQKAERAA